MNLRIFSIFALTFLAPTAFFAQQTGAPAGTQATDQAAPPAPAKPTIPDYPDPRTLTLGVFGWATLPSPQPNLIGGKQATTYSTLDGLGKQKPESWGVEVSYPITRTGELHFEGFEAKGDGSQKAPLNTTLFATGYTAGTYLSTQYQITSAKLYLDDLLRPYKFPVSRFRLKSLWEIQYLKLQSAIDAPLATTSTSTGTTVSNATSGSRTVITPTFGIAAEYALSPHVLLRGDASGFGFPHHSYLWDAQGTISWRRSKTWEFRAGYKVLQVKTSPQKDEYFTDTISGGFFGVRYHWN